MGEIDPITGLPKELGIWENLAKEGQKIRVFIEKKKFGVSQRIEVTPTANLGKLEEVFVVTSLRGLQLPSESTPK